MKRMTEKFKDFAQLVPIFSKRDFRYFFRKKKMILCDYKRMGLNMRDINEVRKDIDLVDSRLLELFEERMDLCKEIGEIKAKENLPTLDKKREEDKLLKTKEQIQNPSYKESGVSLMEKLMELSKKLQNNNR